MRNYIVLFVGILIAACTPTKVIAPKETVTEVKETESCQFKTTLLDYTSDGNCGFLFQLADGTKLLPSTMPAAEFGFYDRKEVLIGYKSYDKDKTVTNSLCGKEDQVVEITCIEEYVDLNNKVPANLEDCQSVKNVFTNFWIPEVVKELKPQKIFEYDYAVGFLYLCRVGEVSHLYDCLGNKLCASDDGGDCNSLIATLGEAKLIQVLKN